MKLTYNSFPKLNIYKLMYIVLLLIIGLPACYINISCLHLRVSVIISILFMSILLMFNKQILFSRIKDCINNKLTFCLLIWCSWILFTGFFNLIVGNYNFEKFIFSIVFRLIPLIILPYFLGFTVGRNIPTKTLLKWYYIFIIIILFIGIINAALIVLDNQTLLSLYFSTLVNNRTSSINYTNYFRIQSVFDEPSYFGYFIAIHILFVYIITKTKYKIFSMNIMDWLLKKMLLPIMFILLFVIKSPIFLIISIGEIVLYKVLKLKNVIFKYSLLLGTVFVFIVIYQLLLTTNISSSNSMLLRIKNTICFITDLRTFVQIEPSLATRIVNYINEYILFKKHILFGVGFGNLVEPLYKQFYLSPVPLTDEILSWLYLKCTNHNFAILWAELAETGLIGIILLFNIFYKVIRKAQCIVQFETKQEKSFFYGCFLMLIIFVLLTIYDSMITGFIWGIIGIVAGYKPRLNLTKERNFRSDNN